MKIKEGLEQEYAEFTETRSKSEYHAGIVQYAADWAALMESAIAAGAALEDVAGELGHSVSDGRGISGFMHGSAVKVLSHFWVHGEWVRQWHNSTTQIRDEGDKANAEGGVLNPAVLVQTQETKK